MRGLDEATLNSLPENLQAEARQVQQQANADRERMNQLMLERERQRLRDREEVLRQRQHMPHGGGRNDPGLMGMFGNNHVREREGPLDLNNAITKKAEETTLISQE